MVGETDVGDTDVGDTDVGDIVVGDTDVGDIVVGDTVGAVGMVEATQKTISNKNWVRPSLESSRKLFSVATCS